MKKLFGGLGLGLLLSSWLVAGDLYMAGGAGYKRPLEAIAKAFEAKSSHQVKMMFGNMQQVSAQIKESDKISLFFGDEKFIQKLGIPYKERVELGTGKLMLVFSKDSKAALEMASLATPLVKSVGDSRYQERHLWNRWRGGASPLGSLGEDERQTQGVSDATAGECLFGEW